MILDLILSLLIGYAFGNILTAEIIGRFYRKSLFEHGSGNPGMTNTVKVLGKKAGALVLLGDILKTCLAIGLCLLLFPGLGHLSTLYCGCGVMLGHCFPLWHHFQGGKGVACAATAFVLYWPLAGIVALLCGGAGILLKRGVKLSAVIIDIVFMIFMAFRFEWISFLPALFMAVLMAWLNLRPNRLQNDQKLDPLTPEETVAVLADPAASDLSSAETDQVEAEVAEELFPGH